jgi:hypothetical protein
MPAAHLLRRAGVAVAYSARVRDHRHVPTPTTTPRPPARQPAADRATPVARPQVATPSAATAASRPAPARADDALGGVLARAVDRRATAALERATLQRTITVGADTYSAATLAAELEADENVVQHDEYAPELASLDAANKTFADRGELMMWLASATMAAKRAAAAGPAAAEQVESAPVEPKKKGEAAGPALTATQVTLAELKKAAPVGGTAGQRYDKQGATHTSVTFKSVRPDVVRIVGFHRTLASGSHIYWAKHDGDGRFKLSSSSGAEIESIGYSKVLEDAWKAVKRVAAKLRCEALEPTWT